LAPAGREFLAGIKRAGLVCDLPSTAMDHPAYYSQEVQRKQHRRKLLFGISVGLITVLLLVWGGWHYSIKSSTLHSSTDSEWVSQQHKVVPNTTLSGSDQCVATPAPIFGHNATLSSYWPLSGKSEDTPVRFAYVFYATEKAYLCNVVSLSPRR
jgi:hypothetical protein